MSTDAIKKFLENTSEYPDTTSIKIGVTEVPLGSLRALTAAERTQLSDRMKAVEEKEKMVNERGQSVVELAKKAQAAYDAAEEARRTAGTRQPDHSQDPFSAPWLAPVKSALETRDKEINSLKDQLKTAIASIGNAATIWAEDRWDREYSGIDFGKREKKPTRQELIDFATKNNLTDRHRMPSVAAAWEKMSAADRLEETREQARQEGIEEGKRQAMAARVPPPGVSGPGAIPPGTGGKPPAGDLGDLYQEAIKDPELRALLEQMPAGIM
jgi:hypothetical protein